MSYNQSGMSDSILDTLNTKRMSFTAVCGQLVDADFWGYGYAKEYDLVPHLGHTPEVADSPFFMVMPILTNVVSPCSL